MIRGFFRRVKRVVNIMDRGKMSWLDGTMVVDDSFDQKKRNMLVFR